jgi:hypothetical protein
MFMKAAKYVSRDLQLKDVKVGMVVNPGSHHILCGLYYHVTQKLQRYTTLDYNHMIKFQGTNARPFTKLPLLFYFTSTLHDVDENLLRECVRRSGMLIAYISLQCCRTVFPSLWKMVHSYGIWIAFIL